MCCVQAALTQAAGNHGAGIKLFGVWCFDSIVFQLFSHLCLERLLQLFGHLVVIQILEDSVALHSYQVSKTKIHLSRLRHNT